MDIPTTSYHNSGPSAATPWTIQPQASPPVPSLLVSRRHASHVLSSSHAHSSWRASATLPPPASTFLTRPASMVTQMAVEARRRRTRGLGYTGWSPRWLVVDHLNGVLLVYKDPAALIPSETVPLASVHTRIVQTLDRAGFLVVKLQYLSSRYRFRAVADAAGLFPSADEAQSPAAAAHPPTSQLRRAKSLRSPRSDRHTTAAPTSPPGGCAPSDLLVLFDALQRSAASASRPAVWIPSAASMPSLVMSPDGASTTSTPHGSESSFYSSDDDTVAYPSAPRGGGMASDSAFSSLSRTNSSSTTHCTPPPPPPPSRARSRGPGPVPAPRSSQTKPPPLVLHASPAVSLARPRDPIPRRPSSAPLLSPAHELAVSPWSAWHASSPADQPRSASAMRSAPALPTPKTASSVASSSYMLDLMSLDPFPSAGTLPTPPRSAVAPTTAGWMSPLPPMPMTAPLQQQQQQQQQVAVNPFADPAETAGRDPWSRQY
ncbi:hypothetical protein H9P43_007516 [Blastocladiella emersonii ATCC 22665]|nr:hypothetical protein H9P43_007516 [Blastocladiella emersonii ATCC 22665]